MGVKLEILISLAVLAPVVASTPASETKTTSSLSSVLARYKFRSADLEMQRDSGLSLRVMINGKPGALLIATSAPISVLDRNSLSKFGQSRGSDRCLASSGLADELQYRLVIERFCEKCESSRIECGVAH